MTTKIYKKAKKVFEKCGVNWVDPEVLELGDIIENDADFRFKGIYFFYEKNLYIGSATTLKVKDRMKSHQKKLALKRYEAGKQKKEALKGSKESFPDGWIWAIKRLYLNEIDIDILKIRPDKEFWNQYIKNNQALYDWGEIKVMVWNLDEQKKWKIKKLETFLIYEFEPLANKEIFDMNCEDDIATKPNFTGTYYTSEEIQKVLPQ